MTTFTTYGDDKEEIKRTLVQIGVAKLIYKALEKTPLKYEGFEYLHPVVKKLVIILVVN